MLHGFLPALDAANENKVFSLGAVCYGMRRLLKEFAGQDKHQNTWWRNRSSWEFPLVPTALGKKDVLRVVSSSDIVTQEDKIRTPDTLTGRRAIARQNSWMSDVSRTKEMLIVYPCLSNLIQLALDIQDEQIST